MVIRKIRDGLRLRHRRQWLFHADDRVLCPLLLIRSHCGESEFEIRHGVDRNNSRRAGCANLAVAITDTASLSPGKPFNAE
jgi:hypothetical protein